MKVLWRVGDILGSHAEYLSQMILGFRACGNPRGTKAGWQGRTDGRPSGRPRLRASACLTALLSGRSWSGSPRRSRGARLPPARRSPARQPANPMGKCRRHPQPLAHAALPSGGSQEGGARPRTHEARSPRPVRPAERRCHRGAQGSHTPCRAPGPGVHSDSSGREHAPCPTSLLPRSERTSKAGFWD